MAVYIKHKRPREFPAAAPIVGLAECVIPWLKKNHDSGKEAQYDRSIQCTKDGVARPACRTL